MATSPDTPGIRVVSAMDEAALGRFDAIIDVRSPAEFAEDHIPGAENLPVLSNEERAEVGAIYVQQSRFLARRVGAALVARNIAGHLQGALADRPGDFRPLVYCWRGGQRSHAMATVLSQVGWRTSLVEGGYRTWRRHVTARLYDSPEALDLVLVAGDTGTAKTEILHRVAALGVQALDLEGLAGHRGSLFGGLGAQPSQKMFESRLLGALTALDPARPVLVEAESSKIGDRMVPPLLWRAMQTAPRVELRAPLAERARYLVAAYGDIVRNRPALEAAFARLPLYPGRKRLADWRDLADAGRFEDLAADLMEHHYDPAYARSARKDERRLLGVVEMATLDESGQARAAEAVAELMRRS
ncbi:MAG TPA: tRNA 2-selenouridine(34) synthase MnmH [Caulobacteraceae bacterium]|nr:tRNA 2-selenouridine(34) synthase MnmH [Caulobacteraceae bacterium]